MNIQRAGITSLGTIQNWLFERIWHSTQEKWVHCRAKRSDPGYDTDGDTLTVPGGRRQFWRYGRTFRVERRTNGTQELG